jgi:ABC-2 type transport system permease protein
LLLGKALGLSGIAALMLIPAMLALAWLMLMEAAPLMLSLVLLGGYAAYLAIWVLLIVIISSSVAQARTALVALIGIWAFAVILLPRLAPDVALASNPMLTRLETDIAIQNDLRKMGDSHNPNDPYFNTFKAQTLKHYGVERVEDLPINYRGLLAMEGEKLTSRLFDDYAKRQFAAQTAQSRMTDLAGVISPTIALRRLSMSTAGTDLEGHRRFFKQAEDYRFAIIQQLNGLQATAITYADDGNRNKDPQAARRVRIDPGNWQAVLDFHYKPAMVGEKLQAALPAALMLLGWFLALCIALRLAMRRLGAPA